MIMKGGWGGGRGWGEWGRGRAMEDDSGVCSWLEREHAQE